MDKKVIITIGRQYGSGGRKIGEIVADKLGISFYDKEILSIAAKESGLCEKIFELNDEKPTSSLLYSLVMDTTYSGMRSDYFDMPVGNKVFLAQFDTIKKIAAKESCVIVGRCADYILEEFKECTSVFINCSDESRIKRIMERENISADKARIQMMKGDKKRASYYNYYSDKRWADAKSYDFCINSDVLGIEGTADLIVDIVKKKK